MTISYDKAIDLLSRREHSRLELKQKLMQRNFSEEEINVTLDQLIKNNFQSDERFSESYVRHRKQSGFGPLKITAELIERGITNALISVVIDLNADEWREQMITLWKRKFSDASRDKPKQFRFLLSRGFSAEMIRDVLFIN
ncbi:MAG: hypothetical protein A3E82_09405 [Gammaproteobacteria bacterium RIFCSPHIGHO2_12_FULL_38_11]|nr:MAG: hypothetical protein A3E82_09405 [Gammaproteobacteria bacterium RIFCSPHIGHO2_12_FULL_38_11]